MANAQPTPILAPGDRPYSNIDGNSNSQDNMTLLDADWVTSAFFVPNDALGDKDDIANRYWSQADTAFTTTRLGGNIGINPKYQYTRYADIRRSGRLSKHMNKVTPTNVTGNHGKGRYYTENIDVPAQRIFLRFGVPQYNSLSLFVARALDSDLAAMARTGRGTSLFYDAARIGGTVAAVMAFPMVASLVMISKAVNWVFARPVSKFYTLKPTMHMYWSMVQNLVDAHLANSGIVPQIMNSSLIGGTGDIGGNNAESQAQRLGKPYKLDNIMLQVLSDLMPDVFRSESFIDVKSVANRAQRVANQAFLEDYENLNVDTASNFQGYLKKELTGNGTHNTYISTEAGDPKLFDKLNKALFMSGWFTTKDSKNVGTEADPRVDSSKTIDPDKPISEEDQKPKSFFREFLEHADAEMRDGSQFAAFIVNYTGQVSESFSNAVVESEISQKLNSQSSSMRSARFTFAEGNIAGETAKAVVGAAADVAMGALDGLTFGFSNIMKVLGGSGFIDIPKHWQSSSMSLASSSYTIKLRSPYNNPISHLMDIWLPFYMLLAGALPMSHGKQSFGSPLLCQVFDRGRSQKKLGMITSFNATRGTTNMGFDTRGNALGVDVTFEITDLSSIMHIPISSQSILSPGMTLDEDQLLSDYLAVLAGQDLYSQIYAMPKAKLRLAKLAQKGIQLSSPAFWAAATHNALKQGWIDDLTLGLSGTLLGILEAPNRGSEVVPNELGRQ